MECWDAAAELTSNFKNKGIFRPGFDCINLVGHFDQKFQKYFGDLYWLDFAKKKKKAPWFCLWLKAYISAHGTSEVWGEIVWRAAI